MEKNYSSAKLYIRNKASQLVPLIGIHCIHAIIIRLLQEMVEPPAAKISRLLGRARFQKSNS